MIIGYSRTFAAPPGGSISFVGSNGTGTTSSTGSMDLTSLSDGSDTAAADGDLVIVMGGRANNSDQTVTMSTAGYTSLGHLHATDTNHTAVELFYKFMGSTPDTTAVIDVGATSTNGGAAVCLVFRGVDPTTPFDGVSVVTATGTDGNLADPGAITPATAGAWICAFLAGANNNSASVATKPANMDYMRYASGGGSTRRLSVGGCYFDGWTSGAFDPDAWTGTDNEAGDSWAAYTLALRPA